MLVHILVFFLLSCQAKGSQISILKPSPCYEVDRVEVRKRELNVFLKLKNKKALCPQVITTEKVEVKTPTPERVNIFVGGKLWKVLEVGKNAE